MYFVQWDAIFKSCKVVLSEKEIDIFWKGQDIFILTSDYEGIGLSMLEAMSFGIVPIVTKVGSEKDVIIVNEENGFVCNRGDILQMGKTIMRLYEDISLLKRVAYNAQRTI